jgi:flavin-dependent dehydrogenase
MADRSKTEFEVKAVRAPSSRYDVAILGGGLAGLTLALQIKRARPGTSIFLADKRAEPAPDAAFKVGESTVENGAYYFREKAGMADHLEEKHLYKLGLRYFWPAGDNTDIARRVEFVTSDVAIAHQIDRGKFENEAFDRAVKLGVDAFRGFRVADVEFGDGDADHTVVIDREGSEPMRIAARWTVDATGRSNLLRRKLGLQTDTGHHINAAWFRMANPVDVESWSNDDEWINREPQRGRRMMATVHLIGQGYWVWLIPLSGGAHSIGICADPRYHPFERMNEFEHLLGWFREYEPQLASVVDSRRDEVLDFLTVQDFSYGSSQVFSSDRWTLVGEAAGFIDAFYSPGSDFIAYTNTFTNDLVSRDLDGEDIEERTDFYNFFFFQLFDPTISLYKEQYQFFGNPQVMLGKLLYDNTAYFSTLAYLFTHDKMTDLDALAEVVDQLQTIIPLLGRVQDLCRDWHQIDQRAWEGVSVLTRNFKPMPERQRELSLEFDDEAFKKRALENIELLKAMAVWLFFQAAKHLPEPPDESRAINPLAISLDPARWEEEGLFTEAGTTLAEALELLPGVEEFDLATHGAPLAAGGAS